MKRFAFAALVLTAATIGGVPAAAQTARMNQPVTIAVTLPEIGAGQGMINVSQYKGSKPLVLFFVSEQCGVTYYYKARLQKLLRDFGSQCTVFLGVRCGKKLHPEEPVELAETKYLKMPFVDDARGELAARFGVRQSLTFAVLDKSGVLRYWGGVDDNVDETRVKKTPLRNALRALAAGKPVAVQTGKTLGCALVPILPSNLTPRVP